jgi:hypothetical protein
MRLRRPLGSLTVATTAILVAASCGRTVEGPTPATTGTDPQVVCGEQLETLVTLRGEGFSPAPVDGLTEAPRLAIPQVTLLRTGDIDGSAVEGGGTWVLNEDPTDPAGDRVQWNSQEELVLRLDGELALERGVYDVHVANATGGEATLGRAFTTVPPPVLDSVAPAPVCTAQHENTVVLTGSWFLTIGDAVPTVTIGGQDFQPVASGCESVDTPREDAVERCTTLTVSLGVGDLPPGAHAVTVTNPEPAHCQTTEAVVFHVVPPPAVTSVTDQPVCLAESERSLLVSGSGFLQIDGELPEVRIGGVVATLVGMDGCTAIEGLAGVQTCTELDVSVAQNALDDGRHDVVVTNPEPAHCHSEEDATLTTVPPPMLTAITPQPVCNAQGDTTVALEGTGFLELRGLLPEVWVGDVQATSVAVVAESCAFLDDASLDTRSCTEITATFDEGILADGLHEVTVTNPLPAGCSTTDPGSLSVAPPPMVASIEPDPICVAQDDVPVTIIGSGFLEIEGQVGLVTLVADTDGTIVTPLSVDAVEGYCTDVEGVDDARTCTRLSAVLQQGSLVEGTNYRVTVVNPFPAACSSSEEVDLGVVPPPEIDAQSITPDSICMGGGTFTVTGTDLHGIEAYIQSTEHQLWASNVTVNEAGTEANLFFSALQPGQYSLHVVGAGGCEDGSDGVAITVETGPTIFFVDPPVVFNGVAMRASIYITQLSQAPNEVAILPSDRTDESGEILLTDITWDPSRPNVVQATIPLPVEGPINPGLYDVVVRGLEGCDAFFEGGLTVVGETTIALADPAVVPGFGQAGERVAVNLHALGEDDRAADEVGFEATPRVYLSSSTTTTAEPLRAVTYENDTDLTAVVPALDAGYYDLIVVNPDGSVGFRENAYRATDIAPPVIEDVFPTQVENDTATDLTVVGENFFFDTEAAELGLTVTAICLNPNGVITEYDLDIDTGASDSDGWSMLTVTLPSGIAHGSACVVRVDNTENETFDEWSALSVTNPAARLPPFLSGPDMVEARRAPAMAVGRATREARFVYAVGGDDGTIDTAKSTVEASPVGRFGDLGTWRLLQSGLVDDDGETISRTLATAHREDRFIYLIGGMTAEGDVVPTVLRSLVLDPLPPAVPDIFDVDIDFAGDLDNPDLPSDGGEGLDRGAWTYMVSAVMADTDPENPGGETLPSEARTVYLPDVPGGMTVSLTWTTVYDTEDTSAQAYYVYRTPYADAPISEMHLIAIVPGTADTSHSYLDDDRDALARPEADAEKAPLRLGALGTWHWVKDLFSPRAAFGLAVAPDPAPANPAAPGQYWYVVGGISADPDDGTLITETSTYEYAHFDPETTTFGDFVQATTNLATRREHGVWTARAESADFITDPNETWIYVGFGFHGSLASPSNRGDIRYAKVLDTGELGQPGTGAQADDPGTFDSAFNAPTNIAGMATLLTANAVYTLGGRQGTNVLNDANLADICDGSTCQPPNLETTVSQSAANDLLQARYLPGFARRGAFFYVAGGANGAGDALSTTERNIR